MIEVKKEGIVLTKTKHGFEVEAVLNPAVIQYHDFIHVFYRAVAKGNYSSIGYSKLKTPLEVIERFDVPVLFSQFEFEDHGLEDPRIVKIEDLFYLTYTAFDGVNALGALATSTDLITWDKKGIIVPQVIFEEFKRLAEAGGPLNQKYLRYNEHYNIKEIQGKKVFVWDKNLVFFPRRINGKLFFLHRIKPDIQMVSVNSLSELTPEFWQAYLINFKDAIVMAPRFKHEINYIGGGCPPIETKIGWLIIYHGVHDTVKGYVYCACAALLDLNNPKIELARLPYPLFKPEFNYELTGEVNNVCFPTGAVVIKDKLYIYYGAADEQIACVSIVLSDLLTELMLNVKHHAN